VVKAFKNTGLHPLNEEAANYISDVAAPFRNPEQQAAYEQGGGVSNEYKRLRPTSSM
jgi:hypothetical protein